MINSSRRKLALSGWLRENDRDSFDNPLKLQKFLFFYESFSKVDKDEYEFKNLKAYKNGPVFSDVYGDYTKEHYDFTTKSISEYKESPDLINAERACVSSAIMKALTEKELSALTHKFNFWNAKKSLVDLGVLQVEMKEEDLNENDVNILLQLERMFPVSKMSNYMHFRCDQKNFFIENESYKRFKEDHLDILIQLSSDPELMNPVYVSVNEEGVLLID